MHSARMGGCCKSLPPSLAFCLFTQSIFMQPIPENSWPCKPFCCGCPYEKNIKKLVLPGPLFKKLVQKPPCSEGLMSSLILRFTEIWVSKMSVQSLVYFWVTNTSNINMTNIGNSRTLRLAFDPTANCLNNSIFFLFWVVSWRYGHFCTYLSIYL